MGSNFLQTTHQQLPCGKVAVFSDIHANYPAFLRCYEDALERGAEGFVFLGDYISDLAQPRETLDLVYEIRARYPTACLRGNRERYMLEHAAGKADFSKGSKTGSLLYTYQQLRPKDITFIESLPIYDSIRIGGVPFEIAHAGKMDDRCLFAHDETMTQAVFREMEADYFLTGHSHKHDSRTWHRKLILNPGSIGVPRCYGHHVQYVLLEIEGQTVTWQFRHLTYDVRAVIRAQFESGLVEYAPYWAIAVLYDVMLGEEYTMELLDRVMARDGASEESVWRAEAEQMGMVFTEREILDFLDSHI